MELLNTENLTMEPVLDAAEEYHTRLTNLAVEVNINDVED